jgi:hypothetical protein
LYCALENQLQIINISDPENPEFLSHVVVPVSQSSIHCIAITDELALIGTYDGLYLYDITDVLNPYFVTIFSESYVHDIEIDGSNIFLGYTSSLKVINIDDPFNIQLITEFDQFPFYDICIEDNYLYVASGSLSIEQFQLIDISDLSNLHIVGSFHEAGSIVKVGEGIICFVSNSNDHADCTFVDISNPENQYYIGSNHYGCEQRDIDIENNILGVCSSENSGVNYFDISDPENPEWLFSHSFGYNMGIGVSTVAMMDDFAIAGFNGAMYDNTCIRIHDLSDPTNIQVLGGLELGDTTIRKIVINGYYAYIGCSGDIYIIDISDMSNPNIVNIVDTGYVKDIEIRDEFLYICSSGDLQIFYLADPENPLFISTWESSYYAEALNIFDEYAYVSDDRGGVKIVNVFNPNNPFLVNTILPHFDSLIYAKPVIQNDKLIISDVYWNELLVYDLTDPAFPILFNSFKWNRPSHELVATEDYLVTANGIPGFTILDITDLTPISGNVIHPKESMLSIYPNPFNPSTTISFSVTQTSSFVTLEIFNIKGQKVKQLVSDQLSAGQHSVVWDGKDEIGKSVSSGIYFCKLKCGEVIQTKRMLMLK